MTEQKTVARISTARRHDTHRTFGQNKLDSFAAGAKRMYDQRKVLMAIATNAQLDETAAAT